MHSAAHGQRLEALGRDRLAAAGARCRTVPAVEPAERGVDRLEQVLVVIAQREVPLLLEHVASPRPPATRT